MSFLDMFLEFPRVVYDRWWGNQYKSIEDTSGEEDVRGKVVVITGANRGLGKTVALHMARRGAVVVMACRDLEKAQDTLSDIQDSVPGADLTLVNLDLSDMDSVRSCANKIKRRFRKVNILINNAAIMLSPPTIHRNKDGFEQHLGTNYLGHVLLTMLLLPHLQNGTPSRIVFVSSMAFVFSKLHLHDLNWEKSGRSLHCGSLGPYEDSKKLTIFFANELSRRLEGTQVRVYSLCPGIADTQLLQSLDLMARCLMGFVALFVRCSAEQGAFCIMYCALSKETSSESGKVYHYGKRWCRAEWLTKDIDVAREIWLSTEALLNTSLERMLAKRVPKPGNGPKSDYSSEVPSVPKSRITAISGKPRLL